MTKYSKIELFLNSATRISLMFIGLLGFFILHGQSAKDIIQEAYDKMSGESNSAQMTMKIIRPDWTREIGIKSWAKGTEKSLVLITAPARDNGASFLKREKELWNWQPTINRVIKMPPSMMMQSWMGSDFTNDDLVRESSIVDDYEHQLLKDTVLQGRDAWKIALIPKEEAPVVWGKIEGYISKGDYLQLLFKYYDEDGYLVNTMILSDIKELGGRQIPSRMEMIPAENPDQKTLIVYDQMQFDIPIEDGFFSIQNMKRVR